MIAAEAVSTYRLSGDRSRGGSLTVTVDVAKLLLVRRALFQSRIPGIGIVKAAPLACGTRVRLMIAVPPQSLRDAMEAIRRVLDGDAAPAARP
jgi:hypothetical protein